MIIVVVVQFPTLCFFLYLHMLKFSRGTVRRTVGVLSLFFLVQFLCGTVKNTLYNVYVVVFYAAQCEKSCSSIWRRCEEIYKQATWIKRSADLEHNARIA